MTDAEQKRFKRQCKAAEEGRTVRAYVKASDGKPQSRAQYKRRYKANKAAREGRVRNPRMCVDTKPHDAHVKSFRIHLTVLWNAVNSLHDAHVRRFKYVLFDRIKQANKYAQQPIQMKARASKRRKNLNDSYVIQQLIASGFRRESIEDFVITMKREHLTLRRLSRELKQAVKQSTKKVNHENITNTH